MSMGDGAGSAPLYGRILDAIRDRILSGEWPPGHRIPFEVELAQAYGCSRMTVNKALSQLARAGLIERRRRSGSFVRAPGGQAAILEIHDIEAEVRALGLPYGYELLSRSVRRAGTQDRARLGLEGAIRVLALRCRHFAGRQPFCLEERLISLAAVPQAEGESFAAAAPGPWLIARIPWSAAEHRIQAVGADAAQADALALPAGTPCLLVERRTWSAEAPVTAVRFAYPGTRHALVARFTPKGG